jgi:hypothetical protein
VSEHSKVVTTGGGIGIGVDGYVTSCLEYFLIEQGVDLPTNIRKTKRIKDAPIIPNKVVLYLLRVDLFITEPAQCIL